MKKEIKYLIFCMETYKQHRNMTGEQVYNHFAKYNFMEYIIELFDILHIQGTNRLLEELDQYQSVQERGLVFE
ncbi:MAG: DUF3791 domain-containing protein [Oscillospiraceae bacterium]|nr:DUF3791 domain-containing protein [Oscillospiraceae bacterium]